MEERKYVLLCYDAELKVWSEVSRHESRRVAVKVGQLACAKGWDCPPNWDGYLVVHSSHVFLNQK